MINFLAFAFLPQPQPPRRLCLHKLCLGLLFWCGKLQKHYLKTNWDPAILKYTRQKLLKKLNLTEYTNILSVVQGVFYFCAFA